MASHRELKPFGLETFSFWFAEELLARHPEWLPLIAPTEWEQEGLKVRTLAINLPSQNPNVAEPLTIAVDLYRIVSVAWCPMGGLHRWDRDWVFFMPRLRKLPDWKDCKGVDLIAEFVEQFLNEEIGAIWTQNEPLKKGSSSGVVTAEDVISGNFSCGEVRTEIRSWRGSLDRTL